MRSTSCKDRAHCVATFSSIPDRENNTPDEEENISDKENNIPDRENNIPDREDNIPDRESNTPLIPTNVFYFTSLADAQLTNPNIQVMT